MATKAYGTITITDLLDTATYIYYSQTNTTTASDWHKIPTSSDKYIGIYSGPPADTGQPNHPQSSWVSSAYWTSSQYVGPQGPQGPEGPQGAHGINTATVFFYKRSATMPTGTDATPSDTITYTFATTDCNPALSNGWQSTVPATNGTPCWVISAPAYGISDTDSILVSEWSTPIKLEGEDANAYKLEVDTTEVYKFMTGPINGSYNLSLTTNSIVFSGYKSNNTQRDKINITSQQSTYSTKLSLINSGYETWHSEYDDLWNLFSVWGKLNEFRTELTNEIQLNIGTIIDIDVSGGSSADDGYLSNDSTFVDFQQILKEQEAIFVLHLYDGLIQTEAHELDLSYCRLVFGTTNEMAKFSVTAGQISAAVADSKMFFDSTGLTIANGSFNILDANNNYLLQYTEDHGLTIKGNGEFTGDIRADSGYFKGDITGANGTFSGHLEANTGTIGGFTIGTDENGNGFLKSTDSEQNPSIFLRGGVGSIYARNLTLGDGATIENYLQLGEQYQAFLYNPDYAITEGGESLPYFFKVANNVYLTANGDLNLNRIVLDGTTSTIKGSRAEDDPNFGWPEFQITPEKAYFPNVEVSGKITSAVFEVGKTQAVGGMMLFKPSFKVTHYTLVTEDGSVNTQLYLEESIEDFSTPESSYIAIIDTNGKLLQNMLNNTYAFKIKSCTEGNSPYVKVYGNIESSDANVKTNGINGIIILGEDNDMIIGINSSDTSNAYLRPRGITISTFDHTDTLQTLSTPNIFIGDLDAANFNITNVSGLLYNYGLYADNVILTGSLTTQVTSSTSTNFTYAGVNTLSQATATIFDNYFSSNPDHSKIVFWGGSQGVSADEIRTAPFQVTEKGSLYAKNGLFEGAIISKSEIKGVDIYGARIHGVAKDQEFMTSAGAAVREDYGLAFFNATQGIVFKAGGDTDDSATTLFGIGQNGLYTRDEEHYFVRINVNTVDLAVHNVVASNDIQSQYVYTKQLITSWLSDNQSSMIIIGGSGDYIKTRIQYYPNSQSKSYIDLCNYDDQGLLLCNPVSATDNTAQFRLYPDHLEFRIDEVNAKKNFQLGTTPGKGYLRYTQIENVGYDLYV